MDFNFWNSRVHSAKHFSPVQAAKQYYSDNHLGLDESEGEEDAKAFFPCPFCYVDIDIHVLCTHLQDEHCFNLRNAVCPLCAANLGNDVIGHFIVQHASSLKKRRKSHRPGPWSGGNNSAVSGRALSSFGGSSTTSSIGNISELAPDLSPFLGSVPELDSRSWQQQQQDSSEKPSSGTHLKSSGGEVSADDRLDREERAQKAAFIQELIASTIFF